MTTTRGDVVTRFVYVYRVPDGSGLPFVVAGNSGGPNVTVARFASADDVTLFVSALRSAGAEVVLLPSAEVA